MNYFTACMGCKDREPGCHDNCDRYLSEKAEYEKVKSKLDVEQHTRNYYAAKMLDTESKKAKRKKDKAHIAMFYN